VHDGKLQPWQDDPDDVHDQRNRAAWRFSWLNLSTKRREDSPGEPETHETERNAYDRQAQQDATENVTQEDYESTEYEEDNVTEQRHGDYCAMSVPLALIHHDTFSLQSLEYTAI
jgi:hypothetical protein